MAVSDAEFRRLFSRCDVIPERDGQTDGIVALSVHI